jgi:hypothetical protein
VISGPMQCESGDRRLSALHCCMGKRFSIKIQRPAATIDGHEMIGTTPLKIAQEITAVLARGEHRLNSN